MSIQVEIANPRHGGNKRTSLKQAEKYIREGKAVITQEGKLFFLQMWQVRQRTKLHKSYAQRIKKHPDMLNIMELKKGTFVELTTQDAETPQSGREKSHKRQLKPVIKQ